ncbi:hypothetical protein L195_g058906, partial [Trifolium pratense]
KIGVTNCVHTSHTSEVSIDICTPADVPCAREADLSFDYRLFEGSTSKALEERKPSVDCVIQTLQAEVDEEGGMKDDGVDVQ